MHHRYSMSFSLLLSLLFGSMQWANADTEAGPVVETSTSVTEAGILEQNQAHETKNVQGARDNQSYPMLVDANGDGVPETVLTQPDDAKHYLRNKRQQ